MNQFDIRQQTLDLLQRFMGLEPLRELLWSHLNYDRVKSQNVTRRGWPDPVASALAEDPSLLAEGGKDGDFKIVYARLAKDRLSLADERIVTTRLLKDNPYGLFVFSDRTQTNWHFVNVRMADDESKRKLYRRVTVGPNEKMRTACQEEVKQRESERQHTLSLTYGQRYVMRELSVLFRASEDEDQKGQITLLEKAFRSPLTKALQRELNLLRKNGVMGESLVRSLGKLYQQHNLRDWLDRRNGQPEEDEYPRIVCSEGLV